MVKIVDSIEKANAVTHCGTMHADEIFATAFLDLYLGNLLIFLKKHLYALSRSVKASLIIPIGISLNQE